MSSSLVARRGSTVAAASLRGLTSSLSNLTVASSSSTPTTPSTCSSSARQPPTPTPSRALRPFSTTPRVSSKTFRLHLVSDQPIPPYPHGPRYIYKQSNSGLYGAARIRTGHNISEDNKVKSLRTWKPNIQRKRLWSDALGAYVRARISIRVLRTLRKEGGVDNYVLKSKAARIRDLGPGGWKLRWLVLQSRAMQEKFEAERKRLGVVSEGEGEIGAETDTAESPVAPNDDLVRVLIDAATPGPLSATSRKTLEDRAARLATMEMAKQWAARASREEFAIGDEAEADLAAEGMEDPEAAAGMMMEEGAAEGEEFLDDAEAKVNVKAEAAADIPGFATEAPPSVVTEQAIRNAVREQQQAMMQAELIRQQRHRN